MMTSKQLSNDALALSISATAATDCDRLSRCAKMTTISLCRRNGYGVVDDGDGHAYLHRLHFFGPKFFFLIVQIGQVFFGYCD